MKKPSLIALATVITTGVFAQQEPIQFTAKGIVTLSDADMSASALADGNLYRSKTSRDVLTVIKFPLDRSGQNMATAPISNSSALYDKAAVVTPNGRFAFVLEGHGPLGDSVSTLKDGVKGLPAAARMFIVDLAPAKPTAKVVSVGNLPMAITINPQGNTLAVASGDAGKEMRLVEIDNTGTPKRVVTAPSPVPNARITDMVWSPNGNFIAYIMEDTQEVGLMKYSLDASKKPNLVPHGKPIKVGGLPATGRFSPDSKFFIVSDIKKGANAQGAGKGELFVVQFSTEDTPAEHKVVSQLAAGESGEAMTVSPDGSMVIVANAGQSYQPFGNAGAGKSSLSVYALDKEGKLTLANEYPFDGIMPQSIEFDKSGNAIAVAVSEYLDYGDRTGAIEFWKVTKGDKPSLEKMAGKISVPRGCHTVRVY
ncbi:6-phosphogluconolactonase (cycloisomerase 2 family) [Larkinella arboricola]|uniref:6-phosphogluconolactonase (Cycloisomerase 2 family) n=1 Tax=Larkinella arboricola TaxID=643671 RepID=A0A327X1B1_LARAB|nr:beta-propeller fold lactonase family protein [Larkinella arboricola]RAJ95999.1 6-phosphogluconolactonase (cycloisomerase 2 family) [Larkinella arboricola]